MEEEKTGLLPKTFLPLHSMSQIHLLPSRTALCAVLLALCAAATPALAKEDAPTRLLNAELPHGTVLENASCTETVFATRQAVRKNPSLAVPLMQRAIASRVSPGERSTRGHDPKDGVSIACECLTRIVQAAVESAPSSKVHELIEVAMSVQPQCAGEIADLLKKPRIDGKDSPRVASADRGGRGLGDPGREFGDGLIGDLASGGYGGGFGGFGNGGFAGSPGFIGSSPSGGAVGGFPPVVVNPLTSVLNP